MSEHFPWSNRIERVLTAIGVSKTNRDAIQAHQQRLCAPAERSPLLIATPRIQGVLIGWGVGAQEMYDIIQYLDGLNELHLKESEKEEHTRTRNREGQRNRREHNRDDYNAYQREYMKGYRAKEKARKSMTDKARSARWPRSVTD